MEEVSGGLTLTVVEIPGPAIGGQKLLQPDPGDDDVPERFQVHRAVAHRGFDVTRGEHGSGDGDQPLPGRIELGGQFGRRIRSGRDRGRDPLT